MHVTVPSTLMYLYGGVSVWAQRLMRFPSFSRLPFRECLPVTK